MSSHICVYCETELSSKSALNKHQKTAKFCIQKQIELGIKNIEEIEDQKCNSCQKIFTTKFNRDRHEKNCKILKLKTDDKITELKSEITELKEKISNYEGKIEVQDKLINKLSDKPNVINNTTNNTNNNGTVNNTKIDKIEKVNIKYGQFIKNKLYTIDEIREIVNEEFDKDLYYSGVNGTKDFILYRLFTDNDGYPLILSKGDSDRFIYFFMNNEGKLERRTSTTSLFNLIYDPIARKNSEIKKENIFHLIFFKLFNNLFRFFVKLICTNF